MTQVVLLAIVLLFIVFGALGTAVGYLYFIGIKPIQSRLDQLIEQTPAVWQKRPGAAPVQQAPVSKPVVRPTLPNPFREKTFAQFVGQATDPVEESLTIGGPPMNGAKRLFDLVATGRQALETATRLGVEFTDKGQAALEAGGRLMQHGDKGLAVVVDSGGKIVEIGRVVGPSAVQVGLSAYTVVVTFAWMLVASDLKKALGQVELKLEKLIELHTTAEWAEFEAAYETVRGCTDPTSSEARVGLQQAIWVAKSMRSRCRQRLANQAAKLTAPGMMERLIFPNKWKADDKVEVEQNLQNLATIQLAVLLEAQALVFLDDRQRQQQFLRVMHEEADALRKISGRYTATWEQVKGRQGAERPVLMTAINDFAHNLALGRGMALEVVG